MRTEKVIPEERLNCLVANDKLDALSPAVDKNAKPVLMFLTIKKGKKTPKYKTTGSFPAIVKPAGSDIAILNSLTGKKELVPLTLLDNPIQYGAKFEYKGHIYEAEYLNGLPRYNFKK